MHTGEKMKLAICNEMFEDWKIEDVFTYTAELGYEAVEIAPFTVADSVLDISETERTRIRKAADDTTIEYIRKLCYPKNEKSIRLFATAGICISAFKYLHPCNSFTKLSAQKNKYPLTFPALFAWIL